MQALKQHIQSTFLLIEQDVLSPIYFRILNYNNIKGPQVVTLYEAIQCKYIFK